MWGLLEQCKTTELGEKIGSRLGRVQESGFFNVKGKEGRILKVKVELDASKVIKGRLKFAELDQKTIEVLFKCERLGCFCNYCAHIGHEARVCPRFLEDKVARV